jgi:hypothetical protein
MADNDTSKIRYDDFISSVQPDPAKPESTIMLSGFVGHGPEGHARVYPDPTLGTWYDIPEGDIIHSMPIADSKLGGSYIWVRASSEIKPGSAASAATETEAVQPQQAEAVVNPTPRTHCHVCNPPNAAAGIAQLPTPATHCFICPPHTLNCSLLCQAAAAPGAMALPHSAATVCTQILCTQGFPTFCGCTPGIDCNAAPGNVQTHAPICTQGFPTICGCTPGIDCGGLAARAAPQQANTGVTVCVTDCVPQGNQMMRAAVGGNPNDPTPASRCFVCDPKMAAAMQPTPTVQTHCFICPPHTQAVHCWTAPVVCDTMQMPTPATRCFICPPVNQTFATICTQVGCPTHQIHCPTQPVVCNLQPTQPVVCGVLPPSFGCTRGCQQGGAQAQPQLEGVMAAPAHPNTAATLCTQQPACPPHTIHNSLCICPTPSAFHPCGHNTAVTVCTQPPGCPPHTIHNSMCICPTPSAVHQCGGQTFTPTIPQHTIVGVCQTFGVCPSIACGFTPVQNGVFTPFGR